MQPFGGCRTRIAAFSAATASRASIERLIAYPTTQRDQASRMAAQPLRINKVTSSAGRAGNQMKRVGLFARYGIIGLRPDDVPGVRA
jgi:hypothetical protein